MLADTVTEDSDIRGKAASLGFTVPPGLVLLPGNLATALSRDDLTYEASSATVKKLLVRAGLEVNGLEGNGGNPIEQSFKKGVEWLGPTLFFGSALLTQNPAAVTIALNMISTYLTDLFRGFPGGRPVKLTVIVERNGKMRNKRIEYTGSAEGLKELALVIERTVRDD
jgi:hypothetical protein